MTTTSTFRAAVVAAVAAATCVALVLAPDATAPGDADSSTATLVVGIVAAFRLAAIAVTGYISAISTVAFVAGCAGCSTRTLKVWLGPRALRRLVFGSSLALVATAAPVPGSAAEAAPQRRPPTMVMIERPPTNGLHPHAGEPALATTIPATTTTTTIAHSTPEKAATITSTPSAPPMTSAPTGEVDPADPPAEPAAERPAARTQPAATGPTGGEQIWTVRPGDHFWSIASAVADGELDRPASEAEIYVRWIRLIELNAAQLVDPGNPDLLLPGQILRL